MLRLLLGTGFLLMAVGFGAAGWQYWQSLPKTAPVAAAESGTATAPEPATALPVLQSWLISPSGGVVAPGEVQSYLAQARFAPERMVVMTRQANLRDLLVEGETLPANDYLDVLADIRAPRLAEGLCAVLIGSVAVDCAVNAARLVPGSVNPVAGTALFRLELVFRLQDDPATMPDLGAHVLRADAVTATLAAGSPGTESAEAALAASLANATQACAAESVGQVCRLMRLAVNWLPGQPVQAGAMIAWLDPLPKGMVVAPPLMPVSGN